MMRVILTTLLPIDLRQTRAPWAASRGPVRIHFPSPASREITYVDARRQPVAAEEAASDRSEPRPRQVFPFRPLQRHRAGEHGCEELLWRALSNASEFNKRVRLLFIAAGTAEESRLKAAHHAREEFEKGGIKYVWYESPGTAHEWLTWRRELNEFAPRLFRD